MTPTDRPRAQHTLPVPAPTPVWLSVHLRCDGNTDELLRGPVLQTIDELLGQDTARSWFYLRYWEGGPHIRLRILLSADRRAMVADSVQERARLWLSAHNPGYPAAGDAYARIAQSLAARERENRELMPWQPHGQTWEQAYVPERAKYGTGASLRAFEQHFRESSDLALRVLRQHPSTTQVLTLAVLLVLTGWGRDDIGPTVQSRGDLVERWSSPAALDRRAPARVRPDLLNALLLRARADDDPWCREWRASLQQLHRETSAAGFTAERWRNGTDICHHLLCNRLGLTLEQELTVRRSAWSAMETAAPAGSGLRS